MYHQLENDSQQNFLKLRQATLEMKEEYEGIINELGSDNQYLRNEIVELQEKVNLSIIARFDFWSICILMNTPLCR